MDEKPITVSVLKDLLKEQTENYNKNMQDLGNSLKKEIKKSEEQVKEHMEQQLLEVKNEVNALKETVEEDHQVIEDLKRENEREKRLRNIIIFKIPEDGLTGMQLKNMVKELIWENCKVDIGNHIDKIYRIGRPDPLKVRPILLSLTSFDKKMEIFWAKKQHQSSLQLADDYAPDVLEARRKLVPVLQTLRDLDYKELHLRQDKLYVGGVLCDEEGWKKLILDGNAKKSGNPGAVVTPNKRKAEVSPNQGNNKKRPNTLTSSKCNNQNDISNDTRPQSSRTFMRGNQKTTTTPIAKFLAQRAVAEIASSPKNDESTGDLNSTLK